MVKTIPVPPRDFLSSPQLIVIRSFDVNLPGKISASFTPCPLHLQMLTYPPGTLIEDLRGGVAGGSILKGVLKVGDEVEIRPGVVSQVHYHQ